LQPLATATAVAKIAAKAAVFLIFSNAFIVAIFLNRFTRSRKVVVLGRVLRFDVFAAVHFNKFLAATPDEKSKFHFTLRDLFSASAKDCVSPFRQSYLFFANHSFKLF
jgi:hypothetical protein